MLDSGTIAAVATSAGIGGIGVIRISGLDAAAIAGRVFHRGRRGGPINLQETASHQLIYGRVVDPVSDATIDEAMLAWMAAPRTYTREDTVEISCHGGPIPVAETLRVVLAAGARQAEPGEFTLRAFLNGRIDLTQAEAVLTVVGAQTAEGLRLAIADLAGDLGQRVRPARDALVALMAHLDALADFPEDEVPPIDVAAELTTALEVLARVVAGARAGRLHQDGARVALVGRPNVGKSSLLNTLVRGDRAIVTSIAGTTRDVIAEMVNLRGIPVTLLDTAGIADSADPIERLGIERSRKALASAAAAVLVLDGSVAPDADDLHVSSALADRLAEITDGGPPPVVIVANKADLGPIADQTPVLKRLPGCPLITLSATTGEGLDQLEDALVTLMLGPVGQTRPALLTARQRAALERALAHLREADAARVAGYPLDLLSVDVRAALHAVGVVTGESIDDAVLDEIFRRFCIGK